jgi:alpha-D-xyloside xylohydrolase
MTKRYLFIALMLAGICGGHRSFAQTSPLLNEPIDISPDFRNFTNTYFFADSLAVFDPTTGQGKLKYKREVFQTREAFNNMLAVPRPFKTIEFPENVYPVNPELAFSIDFISPRTFRIRANSAPMMKERKDSLMFVKEPGKSTAWHYTPIAGGYKYTSEFGSVEISIHPWQIRVYDANGKMVTSTRYEAQNEGTYHPDLPFSFVRRSSDYSRSFNAAFTLTANEKIFGCGESFTGLNKRGQRLVLWADDANGVENQGMYKPIPFYLSSNGYGVFMHTSSPITCDFGQDFLESTNLMIGDDQLDLFVFLGEPKKVLDEYTNITGKSPMPPLWSFGLWMSRITYYSEQDGRQVAESLRKYKIPSDVIHFDTGWFENDWQCDYAFSTSRFKDPQKMISDLKKEGFHISLWQLPYFIPTNRYFKEIFDKNLFVHDAKGNSTNEDEILDFSNPATKTWYQNKLAGLLKMGVGAIKVDFGEAAPNSGLYASGSTGFYEHNLYPLRYNQTVNEITRKTNGENIMWARSAWAGSQRYPIHWGGDASNTDNAMLFTLRGGLSLGLCGFSFWSHDIGGFVQQTPEELYRRWLPFGMLTSHSRAHGAPPKEPWLYNAAFTDAFRKSVEMKYMLMPYVYAQAKACSEQGLPMLRALLVEFPHDAGAWNVEDEYMFGSDILVAPLFVANQTGRDVYLPEGNWVDYQTRKEYSGGWQRIEAGEIPVIIMVKAGSIIPHIKLAQSTQDMDWANIEWMVYGKEVQQAKGLLCLPSTNKLVNVSVEKKNGNWQVTTGNIDGVKYSIQ